VSFDIPSAGISAPRYVYYVSSGQINLWVPLELENQSSAQVKVHNVERRRWPIMRRPYFSTARAAWSTGSERSVDLFR